jgi:hypothetical protein
MQAFSEISEYSAMIYTHDDSDADTPRSASNHATCLVIDAFARHAW